MGFGTKMLLAVTVSLGMGFGASAYLNYAQHEKQQSDRSSMQTRIADLKTQLSQKASAATPTSKPDASPTPKLGDKAVQIPQLGVWLASSEPVTGLTYSYAMSGETAVASFTTVELAARYPGCKPGTALGKLYQKPHASRTYVAGKLVKTLGDYDYYYAPSTYSCANDSAGRTLVKSYADAMTNTIMPTIDRLQQ